MEQQLQKLTLAYAPKDLANKPRQLKSDITREMIDEYEAEIDKERTFQPASLIPVLETPTNLVPAYDEGDVVNIHKRIRDALIQLEELKQDIRDNIHSVTRDKEAFNDFVSTLEEKLSMGGKESRQAFIDKQKAIEIHEGNQRYLFDELTAMEFKKNQLETLINELQRATQENDQSIRTNAGEIERVRRVNQEKIKTMEDEIRILNQGFSINQAPGESEEDYLKRIESMKDKKYSVGTQADAEVYNFKILKKKLSDILTMPDHKLTSVLKLLGENAQVYDANKKFPAVKTRIEKVLGLKSSPDVTTLYNVIVEALEGKEIQEEVTTETATDKTALMKLTGKQLKQLWFEITGTKTPKANGKVLTRKEQIVDEIFRLQALRPDLATVPRLSPELAINLRVKAEGRAKSPVYAPPTPKGVRSPEPSPRGRTQSRSVRVLTPPTSLEVKRRARRTNKELLESEKMGQEDKPKKKVGALPGLVARFQTGEGMQKLVGFGAIKISPAQLQLYNVLRVREPSKHSIRGLPDTRVSKDMTYILSKVMRGVSPSQTELNALSPQERSMYDTVIFKAKLHTQVPHTADMSIADLKRRLSLLEGEVQAGNNNKDIKKELNSVVRQLIELRAISTQNGRNYLKQF
jgi:hypothetical protein